MATKSTVPTKRPLVVPISTAAAMLGNQNQKLVPCITHAACGSEGIGAAIGIITPGNATKVHKHEHSETVLFVMEGWAVTLIGPKLVPYFTGPGDFLFIPNNAVHIGFNLSDKHRVVATETRTDRHFNDDVVLLPELEEKAAAVIADIKQHFKAGLLKLPKHWTIGDMRPYSFIEAEV
ncbi:MAG TPA: cupin domain-containing protein [Candidatus Saccharimonadales bacterium]|nr:cupin domain-containing protein [Candidatus Saccharimonadales bacterium]